MLVNDVALKQGMLAISSKARSNYPQFVAWLATFATFVQCFFPCGWRHNLPIDGSGGKAIPVQPKLVVLYLAMVEFLCSLRLHRQGVGWGYQCPRRASIGVCECV